MKKVVSMLLIATLLLSVSVAFADGEVAASDAYAGVTLRIAGPGGMASSDAEGATDENGNYVPGYNELIAAFLEDYPGVIVEFSPATWSDWRGFLQTAVVGETVDVILHGAMLTDLCLDLTDYIAQDPWVYDYLASYAEQYRADEEDYTVLVPTGLSYCVNPYYALVDLRILEDYGVEAPAYDWTWDDLLAIAQATTGTDPVTGVETYGCYPFKNTGEIRKWYTSYCASQGIMNMQYADYKWDITTTFGSAENVAGMQYAADLIACAPSGYLEKLGRDKYATEENDLAILLSENMVSDYNKIVAAGLEDYFMFLPLPVNEAEAEAAEAYSCSFCGTASIAIAYNAKEPDLAWEFIKWLVTDEYAQEWLVANGNATASHYGIEVMLENMNQSESFTKSYHLMMDDFWESFASNQLDRVDTNLGDLADIFRNYFEELIKGNVTAQEAGDGIDADFAETVAMNHK